MSLPRCERCGATDPRLMVGLTSLLFRPLIGLPPEPGYFYFCPACYMKKVHPRLEELLHRGGSSRTAGAPPDEDGEEDPPSSRAVAG